MTIDADEENELLVEEERDGNVGKISVEGNELTIDLNQNNEDKQELQAVDVQQVQQQWCQEAAGATVCWERFLHIRSIKVLLVENDDSTRHVVTALLRNCNYEVIEAAFGVQAWRILEDLNNHVDLVLTEVAMPCLSGIGLLYKIMNHKTRKNIPVIMMSSYDSMGLVFKCLSKGAVDFLVKPIRKNELKNLWQHVWRRCLSSSGSGSESGIRTQNSFSEDTEKSANNNGCNSGEDNGNYGLKNGDDGSGTHVQSSWRKQPVDIDSPQQAASPPDSTCAQVIRPNVEISGSNRVQLMADGKVQEEEKSDHVTGGKNLVPHTPANLELPEKPSDVKAKVVDTKHRTLLEVPPSSCSRRMSNEQANMSDEFQSNIHDAVNTESYDPQAAGSDFQPLTGSTNKQEPKSDDLVSDSKGAAIGLSLKQPIPLNDKGKSVEDNLNFLKHSEVSAFSRYYTSSNALRTPNDITGSSYVIDNGREVKKNTASDAQIHLNEKNICQGSKADINMEMSSATNKFPVNPLFLSAESTSTINDLCPSSAFRIMKNYQRNIPQHETLLKPIDIQSSSVLSPLRCLNQEQLQHPKPYHLHQHHLNNSEQQQALPIHEKSSLKTLATDSPHCGSSIVLFGPGDGNLGNCSLNISASGSNYGSNGLNGNSTAINDGESNGEDNTGVGGRSGSGKVHGSSYGNRIDPDKLAQREAALSKFCQKRKERCFRKKVCSQNHKRLAEPGVPGEFAWQDDDEDSNNSTDN